MSTNYFLWGELRSGKSSALSELYKRYYQSLFAYGYYLSRNKQLTKDTLHEIFLTLWQRKEELPEVNNVQAYLQTSLRRQLLRQLKNTRIKETGESEDCIQIESSYEDLLITLEEDAENRQKIIQALEQLTPSQKEIIRMRYFENKSYKQIAEITSTKNRTIYNQAYDALCTLRKCLKLIFL